MLLARVCGIVDSRIGEQTNETHERNVDSVCMRRYTLHTNVHNVHTHHVHTSALAAVVAAAAVATACTVFIGSFVCLCVVCEAMARVWRTHGLARATIVIFINND